MDMPISLCGFMTQAGTLKVPSDSLPGQHQHLRGVSGDDHSVQDLACEARVLRVQHAGHLCGSLVSPGHLMVLGDWGLGTQMTAI